MNAKQIWQSALERIQQKISQAAYKTWFHGTSAVSLDERVLTVSVQSTFRRDHLESRFHDLVCSVLGELIGPGAEVRFVIERSGESTEQLDGVAPPDDLWIVDSDAVELPLEAALEPAGAHPLWQATLMTAAPARRDRLGAPPSDRRIQRRASSYAGPELLPAVEWSEPVPLLAQLHSAFDGPALDGRAASGPAPSWEDAPRSEEPGQRVIVEAAGSPSRDQDEDWPEPDEPAQAPPPRRSWRKKPSGDGSGSDEGNGGFASGSEGMLNPRYTFSTFIVGKSNQLAHAASVAASEGARNYNPLFLYGGVGLGKTHLLHAIGHCGIEAGLNVLYTTSDRFTNEIINAIRFRTTEEFRAKYRQIDILLVDDVQFIAGKESTEEEFFHTFNALHNAGKQIVLTSDRVPKAMVTMQDRLRSRFEWGLLADIQPPEYEHRLAILRSKAERMHLDVDSAVMDFIATPECTSVRELEGTLNRVIAFAKLHSRKLTVSVAMEALEHLRSENRSRTLDPDQVLGVIARHYGVSLEALRGKERDRGIVWPRQMAMFLIRQETQLNFKQIATFLERRDHSTVMHGAKRISKAINRDERVRKEVAALRDELRVLTNQQEGKSD